MKKALSIIGYAAAIAAGMILIWKFVLPFTGSVLQQIYDLLKTIF